MSSEFPPPKDVGPLCAGCSRPVEVDEPLWIARPDGSLFSSTFAELDDKWRAIRGRLWHVACVAGKLRHIPGGGSDAALTGRVHDALHELNDFLTVAGGYASMLETQIAGLPANDQHAAERLGEINADVARMRQALGRANAASRRVSGALQPPS
jgi:signal transduction histidine kinase